MKLSVLPVFVLAAIAVSIFGGCSPQPSAPATPKKFQPTVSTKDPVAQHDFYRDVTFTEFSPTLPSGSVDFLDFDGTIENDAYVIVVVTVDRKPAEKKSFTTTFRTSAGDSIVKKWMPASGNERNQARAVFMLPTDVARATTAVDETPMP